MKAELKNIVSECLKEVEICQNEAEIYNVKSKYLGKKSKLSEVLKSLKDLSIEEKKTVGGTVNKIKTELEEAINKRLESLDSSAETLFDETLPIDESMGSLHPVTIVTKELVDIVKRMGFTIVSGPEMEKEYYNFDALNIPSSHPARDMQDTYWLDNGMLLRTQTSTTQIHAMENYGAPIKIAAPGRVFRNEDADLSHDNTFFQFEGMVIDKNINIGNLVYVMKNMLKEVFKKDVKVRLRPGFFPFVEPGFELDLGCLICEGEGCPTCKGSGWIEFCGSGMVHPNVLKSCGIDPKEYNGFAFGMGLTRLAMMKYKISDIRILNSGDIRYLKDFNIE